MIAMGLIGASLGTVLFAVVLWLFPPKPSVLVQLGRLDARTAAAAITRPAPPVPETQTGQGGRGARGRFTSHRRLLGASLVAHGERRGLGLRRLRQDLALAGRDLELVVVSKVAGFAIGFVVPTAAATVINVVAGYHLPVAVVVPAALVLGCVLFCVPDLEVHHLARVRRREFRQALSVYLDLVALEMAGSAAPAEALPAAARIGNAWPMTLLHEVLQHATLAGRDHWAALSALGQRIGVGELEDLAGLVDLVGRDGARVRQTLNARASTLRRRELAEIESDAGRRDQSILLAQVIIAVGFFVFLGYPAITSLTTF